MLSTNEGIFDKYQLKVLIFNEMNKESIAKWIKEVGRTESGDIIVTGFESANSTHLYSMDCRLLLIGKSLKNGLPTGIYIETNQKQIVFKEEVNLRNDLKAYLANKFGDRIFEFPETKPDESFQLYLVGNYESQQGNCVFQIEIGYSIEFAYLLFGKSGGHRKSTSELIGGHWISERPRWKERD